MAEVAVETGIPPQFLMDDAHMLKAIVAVLADKAKRQKRSRKGVG